MGDTVHGPSNAMTSSGEHTSAEINREAAGYCTERSLKDCVVSLRQSISALKQILGREVLLVLIPDAGLPADVQTGGPRLSFGHPDLRVEGCRCGRVRAFSMR